MSEISSDLAEIIEVGTRVFGSAIKAAEWLNRSNMIFGGTPIEYLNKVDGKTEVLKALNAIAYGGVI